MDRNRQLAALAVLICIAYKFYKRKGKEQGCQEIKSAVLIAVD